MIQGLMVENNYSNIQHQLYSYQCLLNTKFTKRHFSVFFLTIYGSITERFSNYDSQRSISGVADVFRRNNFVCS